MARWWQSQSQTDVPTPAHEPHALSHTKRALTAAVLAVRQARERIIPQREVWQEEVWGFYDALGEFRYGVDWLANSISRVRLRAGYISSGRDEPEIQDDGTAAELIAEFGGDVGGRAALLRRVTELLQVPGESWIVGETVGKSSTWVVKSTEEIRTRPTGRSQMTEIIDTDMSSRLGRPEWRSVADDSLIARIWRPHARFAYLADSPARAARPIMRELELVNRHIISQYLSRLASAGIIVLPEEVTFPTREEFADAPDPLVAEWIETAKEAIATPGTAAAVIPIPMRMAGEWIEKVRHIDFTLMFDEKIIEKRESAIKRLATELDLPAEVLLGMGDVNHWSAWQLSEDGIKVHITPVVELICAGLTRSYLHPRMQAAGEDTEGWVVWYDLSELVGRPDRSAAATEAYDRLELSGRALRREKGFDEDDAPTDDEITTQVLKKLALLPVTAFQALEKLTGVTVSPAVTGGDEVQPQPTDIVPEDNVPPDTQADEPPPPDDATPSLAASLITLTDAEVAAHRLLIELGDKWHVLHPRSCGINEFTCPVTWAAHQHVGFAPGTLGRYHVRMVGDKLELGERELAANGEHVTSHVR